MKYQIQYKHKDKTYIENMYLSTSKAISTLSAFIASTVTEIRQYIYNKSTKTKVVATTTKTYTLTVRNANKETGTIKLKAVKSNISLQDLRQYASQYLLFNGKAFIVTHIDLTT